MRRRTFLSLAGGAGAAAMLGPWVGTSRAASFGTFPTGTGSVQLPDAQRAKKVLEIFLYGGLSAWETLYFVRDYGTAADPQFPNSQYYAYAAANAQAVTGCGGTETARPFANDEDGALVELGPFASRLATRTDLVDRMRLVVQRHNLEPHEAAVPMALTGRPVGQPNAAGLGAHIQRARIDGGLSPGRASPHAYVFSTADITSDNVAAAAAAGTHPGAARPLMIRTDNAATFATLLDRSTVPNRANHDGLVQAYIDQYNGRLTWPERGRVRSPRTDDLAVAFTTTTKVDAIRGVVTPDLFQDRAGTSCGVTRTRDITQMALSAARHLLTHPTEPASYVCVSDTGLYRASGGGGYDTHDDNAVDQAINFDNMTRTLLSIVNAPGENDPTKLDLDDTLIILNTEFGRTPGRQGNNGGRNHHPWGYVTAFIGGPITADYKGVSGAIGRDGMATRFATPAENRMAALLAMGIWPFAPESFNVADAPAATNELDAAQKAMAKFLGRVS